MRINRQWLGIVIGTGCIFFVTLSATPSWATGLDTNQAIEQPATLVGPKADSPVPIYLRPAANQPNVGYGMNGSGVMVLEQLASFLPEADQASSWNHIRLDDAPYTEGWVQGRFLSTPETVTDLE